MKVITQNFIGSTEDWKKANPKLYDAAWGFEKKADGKVFAKLGNGEDLWNDLEYFDFTGHLEDALEKEADERKEADHALADAVKDEADERKEADRALAEAIEKLSPEYLEAIELTDEDESDVLPPVTALSIIPLFQKIRDNLKYLFNQKVDKENNCRLMAFEEAEKLESIFANPYGSTMPPGMKIDAFINDEWLPLFRLIKLEGQIIDIGEDSPYYRLGQIIYVGDENNDNPALDGNYKVNDNGERDTDGTKMVMIDMRGMFTRGAGQNSRHIPSANALYDGKLPGEYQAHKLLNHSHSISNFVYPSGSGGVPVGSHYYLNFNTSIWTSSAGNATENAPASISCAVLISY